MIGGFILADGLGLASRPTDLAPRLLTTVVLLTGMGMALLVIKAGLDTVPAIVAAQAVTVVASPLIAGSLLWLTNIKQLMGNERNGPVLNLLGVLGLLLLLQGVSETIKSVWAARTGIELEHKEKIEV